ncbi:MAG: hypothetical protein WCU88_07550 [Elusimicrobiota bacterium]|jgi:hypothetical protein
MKSFQEEIGDLFVTESSLTVKLHPSRKTESRDIQWFSGGTVRDRRSAARDIQALVDGLSGKKRVVRGLTVMTDRGASFDVVGSGLAEAVEKAGYSVLN